MLDPQANTKGRKVTDSTVIESEETETTSPVDPFESTETPVEDTEEFEEVEEDEEEEEEDGEQPDVSVESTGKSNRPFNFTAPAYVWGDALAILTAEADATVRKGVAKDLSAIYDGSYENDDTTLTISPTAKGAPEVASALKQLGFEHIDLGTVPGPEKGATAASAPRPPKAQTFCLFSGLPTGGGNFLPGYDMKLKGALVRVVEDPNLGDEDTVTVGTGTAATEYTWEQAIAKLLSFPWKYTDAGLRLRRQKAVDAVQAKADAAAQRELDKANKAAEKAAAKAASAEAAAEEDEAAA